MAQVSRTSKTTPKRSDNELARLPPRAEIESAPAAHFGGAAHTEAAVPDLATQTEAAPLPTMPVKPPFVFAWHVSVWLVMQGHVIPGLQQIRLQPGASKVRKDRSGRFHIADMRAHKESRGWRLIPYDKGPDGQTYMRRTETDPDGLGRTRRVTYHTAWETPYAGSSRVVSDEAGYVTWLRGLIEDGTIPRCPMVVLRRLEDQTASRLARLEQRVGQGAHSLAAQVKDLQADLDTIRKEIKAWDESAAIPVPGAPADDAEVVG